MRHVRAVFLRSITNQIRDKLLFAVLDRFHQTLNIGKYHERRKFLFLFVFIHIAGFFFFNPLNVTSMVVDMYILPTVSAFGVETFVWFLRINFKPFTAFQTLFKFLA